MLWKTASPTHNLLPPWWCFACTCSRSFQHPVWPALLGNIVYGASSGPRVIGSPLYLYCWKVCTLVSFYVMWDFIPGVRHAMRPWIVGAGWGPRRRKSKSILIIGTSSYESELLVLSWWKGTNVFNLSPRGQWVWQGMVSAGNSAFFSRAGRLEIRRWR